MEVETPRVPIPLGMIVMTPAAALALETAGQRAEQLLARHLFADWGEVDEEDWKRNDLALQEGTRLLSSYSLRDRTKVWIITEWDRSVTTLLLPSEY